MSAVLCLSLPVFAVAKDESLSVNIRGHLAARIAANKCKSDESTFLVPRTIAASPGMSGGEGDDFVCESYDSMHRLMCFTLC